MKKRNKTTKKALDECFFSIRICYAKQIIGCYAEILCKRNYLAYRRFASAVFPKPYAVRSRAYRRRKSLLSYAVLFS